MLNQAILETFKQYVKDNKQDINAHISYGYLLFTKAVFSTEPKNIFALYKDSRKILKHALKLDSNNWRAQMTIATLYKHAPGEMKLTDDAIDILEKVIADQEQSDVQNEYSQAYKDLSYVYEQLGEYDKAVLARNRGAEFFPDEPYFKDVSDSVDIVLSE